MDNSIAKKLFAVGSVISMVVSLVTPVGIAQALGEHPTGQNVSDSQGTVYMIIPNANGTLERRPYTSAGAFLSYGFNSFSTVVAANAADLSLPVGSFIPPQDGGLITSDRGSDKGTTYFITGGQKAGFTSEAVFKGLGFSFANSSFADVSFLPTAANIDSETQAHRPGTLVNKDGTVFLVGANGFLGIPDLATFNSWGYSFKNVVPANAADRAAVQTGVMATRQPGQLSPTNITNPNPNPNPSPITGVTASLSASTPSAGTIPSGSYYAKVLGLRITNPTGSEIRLTGATVRRTGILADSDVQGILVTDGSGILHGSLVTFGQSIAYPGFANDPIVIAPNSTVDVTFNVNIRSTATTGTIGMSINSASDLTFTDSTGNPITVGGTFPIQSNLQNIVTGTGSIGAIKVSSRTIVGGNSTSRVLIDQGTLGVDVAKFRIQEVTGNEDVCLRSIELQNNGSASSGDFSNIKLIDQENNVIATVPSVINNIAKFSVTGVTGTNAGPNGCYLIPNGQLRDFTVRIDTSANTNAAGRTLNFTVQNDFRLNVVGLETGVGVTPTADSGNDFPVGDGILNGNVDTESGENFVEFRAGTISVSRDAASRSGKLAKGETNVALAKFNIVASGEGIEIQELAFQVVDQNGSALTTGDASLNGTLKIQQENGSNIYSETASNAGIYGTGGCTISSNVFTGTCTGTPTLKTLSSFYTIQPGTTGSITFVGDIFQSATATDGYTVKLLSIKFRKVSSNTFTTSGAVVSGNGLTVEDSNLTVTKSSSYNPINQVKGGSLVKIASFDLQAGAAEDQRVNAIKVRTCIRNGTISTTNHCDSAGLTADLVNVSSTTLKIGSEQLAPSQNITTIAGNTFSTNFIIAKNQTKTVDVYAVVSTAYSATNLAAELTVTSVTGTQSQTTNTKAAVVGQNIVVSTSGGLQFQNLGNDGFTNVNKLLHANETDVALVKFKVRADNNEDITLQKIYFGGDDVLNTFIDYKLFNEATGQQLGQSNNSIITTGDSGEIRFGGLSLNIVKGGEVNLILKGTTVNGNTIPTSNFDADFGVTFTEFNGTQSGINVRQSGGIVVGSFTDDTIPVGTTAIGDDFLGVNDVANFEVGDLVAIDFDNDSVFTDTYAAQGGTIPQSSPQFVKTVGSNSITFASYYRATISGANPGVFTLVAGGESLPIDSSPVIANGDTIRIDSNADGDFNDTFTTVTGSTRAESETFTVANFAANAGGADTFDVGVNFTNGAIGGNGARIYVTSKTQDLITTAVSLGARITNYPFSSFGNSVREVEPVITGIQVGSGSQVTENEIGTFKIENQGGRSLTVKQLRFEISGSYNVNSGFAPKNFKLDRADASTGARVANTFNNGASLSSPSLVYTLTGAAGNATVVGTPAATATTITIDDSAGGASNHTFVVGDRIRFVTTTNTNGGVGYRLTAVSTTSLSFTPGLQVALADNTDIEPVASNPTVGADAVLESGQVIRFDIAGASLTEEIGSNSSKGYVVLADTTNIKNNSSQGTTATTQVRMLGSKASPTPVATDGLQWSYVSSLDNTTVDNLTISDSYIVSGKSLLYQ